MESAPNAPLNPRMRKRFKYEMMRLKQRGVVRPHLPSGGRCVMEHIPSGKTATLILDSIWPMLAPVMEDSSGERFQIKASMWNPKMWMVNVLPSFFETKNEDLWSPTHLASNAFQP